MAALFLVVASACGGDDDDDDGGDNEATATKSADGGDDAGEETPSDDGGDDGGDDSSDAAGQLAALAGEYEKFEGYVKYEARDFGGDAGFSSMAIYQKGDSSRIDIESADGNVILINTPDATYMCTANQCSKFPVGEDTGGFADAFAGLIDPSTIESEFGDLGDDVEIDVSSEEIAGVDATCFSASGDLDEDTPGDEAGEVCFTEGGLLLRITFDSAGESGTLEATEADNEVPDDAFEPPFEVIDLSDLGQP